MLIIGPDPFISQSSPDHSSQPRIDFWYYEILGPSVEMRQFRFFWFLILFFKAREQIENENGQQLDSEKKAMDKEDEALLASVAKRLLQDSVIERLDQ